MATPSEPTAENEPSDVTALVTRLNEWCAGVGDDCAVYAGEGQPDRVPSGETGGMVTSVTEELQPLGFQVRWENDHFVAVRLTTN